MFTNARSFCYLDKTSNVSFSVLKVNAKILISWAMKRQNEKLCQPWIRWICWMRRWKCSRTCPRVDYSSVHQNEAQCNQLASLISRNLPFSLNFYAWDELVTMTSFYLYFNLQIPSIHLKANCCSVFHANFNKILQFSLLSVSSDFSNANVYSHAQHSTTLYAALCRFKWCIGKSWSRREIETLTWIMMNSPFVNDTAEILLNHHFH